MRELWDSLKSILSAWVPLGRDRHAPHYLDQRLARRISARIPVFLYGHEGDEPFQEHSRTINVSARGAFIRVKTEVNYAQKLILTNLETNEDLACRVARLLRTEQGSLLAGVEFLHAQPGFWGPAITEARAARKNSRFAADFRLQSLRREGNQNQLRDDLAWRESYAWK